MKYEFNFVLRSDDFHPVNLRLGNNEAVIKEVLYLDSSAHFVDIDGTIAPEGTGNVCTFTSKIESENPVTWFSAAQTYAELRHLEADVSMAEYREHEIVEEPDVVEEPLPLPPVEEIVKEQETIDVGEEY